MNVSLILVPYDSGRRGERMGAGPAALVDSGIADALRDAGHHVSVHSVEAPNDVWPSEIRMAFELAAAVSDGVRHAQRQNALPVVLAGNCGIAALGACAAIEGNVAVVWADAHGDFNTPDTTTGGFLDGMALATLCGRCWPQMTRHVPGFRAVHEERVWLVGARALDPLEAVALDTSRINRVSVRDVHGSCAATLARELHDDRVYLHLDLDVIDPSDGQANGYSTPDGVNAVALTHFCSRLQEDASIAAIAISAYDPAFFDTDGRIARVAASLLIASTGGKQLDAAR
jgi:arginase